MDQFCEINPHGHVHPPQEGTYGEDGGGRAVVANDSINNL